MDCADPTFRNMHHKRLCYMSPRCSRVKAITISRSKYGVLEGRTDPGHWGH